MDITNRSVFIAGGTSGIGLELARQLTTAGSRVTVGGRRTELFDAIRAEGIDAVEIDVTDDASVAAARDAVLAARPDLDLVVTMSGVLLLEDLRDAAHFATAAQTIETNVLGTIRVIDAFTRHLIARGGETGVSTIMTVSSGIGFLPFPPMPTYGASKAAVHAYSESLRAQLDGTGVDVVELVPPAVALTAEHEAQNARATPVVPFVAEVLELASAEPTPHELLVEGVRMHRWAEKDGTYHDLVAQRSQALAMLPSRQQ